MQDFYLIADDELTLLDALPDWLTDGVDVIPAAPTHALFWGVPVPHTEEFHAVLRLMDESKAVEIQETLGDFMAPRAGIAWQELAA